MSRCGENGGGQSDKIWVTEEKRRTEGRERERENISILQMGNEQSPQIEPRSTESVKRVLPRFRECRAEMFCHSVCVCVCVCVLARQRNISPGNSQKPRETLLTACPTPHFTLPFPGGLIMTGNFFHRACAIGFFSQAEWQLNFTP